MLRFHQEHLASTEEREQQRAHWRRIVDQVAAALDQQQRRRAIPAGGWTRAGSPRRRQPLTQTVPLLEQDPQ